MSISGLQLRCGEGVLAGSFRGTTVDRTEGEELKVTATVDAEIRVSREGSLGETNVSNAWMVSSEDGETLGPVETAITTGSLGGFLDGVVTNLMTDGVGS